jgi:hypothetical protein
MRTDLAGLAVALLLLAMGAFSACENDASPGTSGHVVEDGASQEGRNPPEASCPGAVNWSSAARYAGQHTTIHGPVVDTAYARGSRGQPTFLNLGRPYPDRERFTVVIWSDARGRFDGAPEVTYMGKTVCVSGTVELYRGSPQIVVTSPSQIELQ